VRGARRAPGPLDWAHPDDADPPLIDVFAACPPAGPLWLGGGEPTLRADLPALLEGLGGRAGMITDGLALTRPERLAALQARGLRALQIPLHSALHEAHDWLVGLPGAARGARRALQLAAGAGLPVTAQICATRPTMAHLPDAVRLAARLGARAVVLRRPTLQAATAATFLAVSPRLGLLEPHLEAAVQLALDLQLELTLEGFPRCAAPRAPAAAFHPHPALRWPAGLPARWAPPGVGPGCPACPGAGACAGAPADYVQRFGRAELDSEAGPPAHRPAPLPPAPGATPPPPPPRGQRSPASRLRFVVRQTAFPDLGGDPMAGLPAGAPPAALSLELRGPSRALRQQLVRLAQRGAPRLEVWHAGAHPDGVELLREALRLGFTEVHAVGDLLGLEAAQDRQLVGLRGLRSATVRLRLPEVARAAALLDRLARLAGVEVRAEGLLDEIPSDADKPHWEASWGAGALPGPPAFAAAAPLPPDPLRAWAAAAPPAVAAALRALLPP
jgi:hypothetical protein